MAECLHARPLICRLFNYVRLLYVVLFSPETTLRIEVSFLSIHTLCFNYIIGFLMRLWRRTYSITFSRALFIYLLYNDTKLIRNTVVVYGFECIL